MALSDKTRKVLWGRSGNRCAVCRLELVVEATSVDQESIVGEECHLISGRPGGPRHDGNYPSDCLDAPENLILLCRVHHKMVDDQCETYTVEIVRALKANHETWVSSTLANKEVPPVRLRRIPSARPTHLMRVTSGIDLMNLLGSAVAFEFRHDEPESESEAKLIGAFLQEAQDWGDLQGDLEAGARVEADFRMSTLLREIQQNGFSVFCGREVQRLEGGLGSPSPFPIAIVWVARSTNAEISKGSAN